MSEGRCQNCRHVQHVKHVVRQGEHFDVLTCNHPKFLIGYGWSIKDMPNDGLLIEDDEGWAWCVGPNFGCIHFEKGDNQ